MADAGRKVNVSSGGAGGRITTATVGASAGVADGVVDADAGADGVVDGVADGVVDGVADAPGEVDVEAAAVLLGATLTPIVPRPAGIPGSRS